MFIHRAGASAVCLVLATSAVHAAEKRFEEAYTVQPGGKLSVEANEGDVIVTGTNSDRVVVRVVMSGSERSLERMTLTTQQKGNDVLVTAKHRNGDWRGWISLGSNDSNKISIEVPRGYNVDLRTSAGDLSVSQLTGEASVKTSDGDIHVADIVGPVHLQTSSGDIELANIKGSVVAISSSGDLLMRDLQGQIDVKTSDGDINAHRIDGRIAARTSSGDVNVQLLGSNRGVTLDTSSGNIDLRVPKDISALLDASSDSGSVRAELAITTTTVSERRLQGTINGGGDRIHARTSDGDVRLHGG